jgi:hypothetical protein
LDGAQNVQAAPMLGLGLLTIAPGFVDLSQQSVGGALFQPGLRQGCHLGGPSCHLHGSLDLTLGKMHLAKRDQG